MSLSVSAALTAVIPADWKALQLRRSATIANGGTPTSDEENWDGDIPFITPPDLRAFLGRTVGETGRTLTSKGATTGSTVAEAGVIISNRAPIGYVAQLGGLAAFNQGCKVILPRGLDQSYLMYALLAASPVLQALGQGTTFMELSSASLASLMLPVPPLKKQRAVADFLDRETTKIDALIEKQNALIDRLSERRLAARNEVLGLDDPSKPGETSVPLATVFREVDRRSPDGVGELLSVSHLTGVTPRSEKNVTMFEAESTAGYKLVNPGDLVINTMWAWMGALGFARVGGIVSPAYNVYRFNDPHQHDVGFWEAYLGSPSFVSWMAANSTGIVSSRLRLYPDAFLRLRVQSPKLADQQRRGQKVKDDDARIYALVAKAARFVDLVRERRSALITAAVTGQIDVSGVAAA